MVKTAVLLALALALLQGCGDGPSSKIVDRCKQVVLFQTCLVSLPAGPAATKYNDWDEVVDACNSAAFYQSVRMTKFVEPECR